jgi:membrane protease YdiL (CAAX protease family)
MKSRDNKNNFFRLLILALLSVICVIPYVITIQGDLLRQAPISLPVIFAAQFLQSILMFSIFIFAGMALSKKIGFDASVMELPGIKKLKLPVILGIVTASAIYLTDIIFTGFGVSISTHVTYAPVWQKLLASFYGGITEEIIMRLFLMSLLVWIFMKLGKKERPQVWGIWISIILSSIIFGLGHLPITASITQITPMVILRAIFLNGIGGIIFGWLYWKKGLLFAMVAHFTTDIFLLTLLTLLFG